MTQKLSKTDLFICQKIYYFMMENGINYLAFEDYDFFEDTEEKNDMILTEIYNLLFDIVVTKIYSLKVHEYIEHFYIEDGRLCVSLKLNGEEYFTESYTLYNRTEDYSKTHIL